MAFMDGMPADAYEDRDYPKYHVTVDGRSSYMGFRQAARVFSSLYAKVDVGTTVLLADKSTRHITKEEYNEIVNAADELDASK